MAISPKILSEKFMNEVDHYEQHFDRALMSYTGTLSKLISIDVPRGMYLEHFRVLKQRYINAGWEDVTYNDDQREGTWLVFKMKTENQ
jgi:hypothetical protein